MDVKLKRLGTLAVAVLLAATLASAGASAEKPVTPKAQKPAQHSSHHIKKARKKRVRGQKAIDGDRVRQIQEALIREHYLKGEPSGKWDANTQQAMHRYQSGQGWQSKSIPDSRALIRLGLGPDSEHLLNPDSAMTMSAAPSSQNTRSRGPAKVSSVSMPTSSSQVSAPAASTPGVPAR
jgi:peptidoglycan hydrolase-like protein with peptidoglycan-binding domain